MAAGSNRIWIGWVLAILCWFIAIFGSFQPLEEGNGYDSDGDGIDDNCDSEPFRPNSQDGDICDDAVGHYGTIGCCCLSGFLCLGIAESGRRAKAEAEQTLVVWAPQQPVQQIVQHTTHNYAPQPMPAPVQQVVKPMTTHTTSPKSKQDWAIDARNLERARDWEDAAKAYQMAGMYEEAGRVRQEHLEKDNAGVNIHVKSGDTYHDSVVMKDKNSNDQNQP
ncbi:MAG: hypothetical protein VX320_04560 [Candidatus Thermoplasmatota archaeon]|nr:hypothetical protein [Candidatus Thermoplasmatota archaeon]